MVRPLWKTVRRLLKKLRTKSPYDPAVPLLGSSTSRFVSGRAESTTQTLADPCSRQGSYFQKVGAAQGSIGG